MGWWSRIEPGCALKPASVDDLASRSLLGSIRPGSNRCGSEPGFVSSAKSSAAALVGVHLLATDSDIALYRLLSSVSERVLNRLGQVAAFHNAMDEKALTVRS